MPQKRSDVFRPLLAAISAAVFTACSPADRGTPRYAHLDEATGLARVGVLVGLDGPEAVRYDAAQDVYFISNIVGFGSVKDSAGYISRVAAGDLRRLERFVESGRDGALLHAPKGMTIQGDTLWVADIDIVRGFHRLTGVPVAELDFREHGAVMLNDLDAGPDGSLYVTDSGLLMLPRGVVYVGGDKIFRVTPDRRIEVVVSEGLDHPNGIVWDPYGERWVAVSFGLFHSRVYVVEPSGVRDLVSDGEGRFDGVAILPDGLVVLTSWQDESVQALTPGGRQRLVVGVPEAAALHFDSRRERLAIPLVLENRVEFWEMPPGTRARLAGR